MDIKIIVAAHKPYAMPQDSMYLPLHVGAEGKEPFGFEGDNTGEHISEKNPTFCELTGLYWAWKNLDAEYIGLAHYRRHFGVTGRGEPMERVLTEQEANLLLEGKDGLLPNLRKYYIETLYDHYAHTCYVEPLDETGKIIKEKYPAYYAAFEALKTRRSAHMFNMFILRRDHLDAYCTWLFDILFELEKRVDASQYDAFHARFFGRVSELLLDVWLSRQNLDLATAPVVNMEPVNWLKKGGSFLAAKLFGKKYGKSF
ncbi:MAG: DUF4422 domain-containing protein [Clostridia bacterium]|nr:DUF4422 domain-containing protein [Clostridia bacterium]